MKSRFIIIVFMASIIHDSSISAGGQNYGTGRNAQNLNHPGQFVVALHARADEKQSLLQKNEPVVVVSQHNAGCCSRIYTKLTACFRSMHYSGTSNLVGDDRC